MNLLTLCVFLLFVPSVLTDDEVRNAFKEANFQSIPRDDSTGEDHERLKAWRNPKNDVQFKAKRELGEKFFFDPRLSKTKNLSCHSCHQLSQAGVDGLTSSIGFLGMINPHKFNTPTILNTGLHKLFFWDGRSPSLENQALISFQGLHEMALNIPIAVERFDHLPDYQIELKRLYGENFPDKLGSKANIERAFRVFDNVTDAIAHYQRSLLTRSKFDAFMDGENNLSEKEIEGAKLFISVDCIKCHNGPALGGHKKSKFPVYGKYPYKQKSLYSEDENFKIPSLRNVALTGPYYHNGAVQTLEEAVVLMARLQLNKKLVKNEVLKIVAFLNSLNAKRLPLNQPKLPVSRNNYSFH
ncbi:MAG: cytochrome c peroxidase [bacterium]|nr:cytochrome c peroxidase [bacterium]